MGKYYLNADGKPKTAAVEEEPRMNTDGHGWGQVRLCLSGPILILSFSDSSLAFFLAGKSHLSLVGDSLVLTNSAVSDFTVVNTWRHAGGVMLECIFPCRR